MKMSFSIFFLLFTLSSCALHNISVSIEEYKKAASFVSLGDSKEKVLSLLLPTQSKLGAMVSKPSEAFIENDNTIEIFYMRSGWKSDGLTTDDEFTPYVFTNSKLTSIGWTALGGLKKSPKNPAEIIM